VKWSSGHKMLSVKVAGSRPSDENGEELES